MKSHFIRVFKNKISIAIILVVILIPCIEIIQHVIAENNGQTTLHPTKAFFLSATTLGHATQIILLWFLPIYLLLAGADFVIQDHQTGVKNVYINKIGRKKYHLSALGTSFATSFLIMYVALMINLIFVTIIFNGGTSLRGMNESPNSNELLLFGFQNPYLISYLFLLITSFLAGLMGMVCTSFGLFFSDKKYAYPASFLLWLYLVIRPESIMYATQPFTEYGLDKILPIIISSSLIMISISTIIYFYEVKFSET